MLPHVGCIFVNHNTGATTDMNANLESLRQRHGDNAEKVFREIADLGGYGSVGGGEGQIHPQYKGGLDLVGVLAESNTAVSTQAKDRISELVGISRAKADNHIGESSADKVKSGK